MIVRDATAIDIERVVLAMRDADAFEVYAERFDKSPSALIADFVTARARALGFLALCNEDGAAVALLAALLVAPERAEVAMIATNEWHQIAAAATRFALRQAIPAYLGGVASAECRVWSGNIVARQWLKRLGFVRAATFNHYTRDGETFLLYRWVNPDIAASFPAASSP